MKIQNAVLCMAVGELVRLRELYEKGVRLRTSKGATAKEKRHGARLIADVEYQVLSFNKALDAADCGNAIANYVIDKNLARLASEGKYMATVFLPQNQYKVGV